MPSRTFLSAVVLLTAALSSCNAQNPALHKVNRIRIGSMGSGAEAERFQGLLIDELGRVGFKVSETMRETDAVLSGEFSTETHGNFSSARVTVLLKSPDGKHTIWSGDYVSQHRGEGHEDVVKRLAATCSEQLQKDWEK